jgi:hypothetical protein
MNYGMSAFGPKRTSLVAPHTSAFGCKADMALCGNPLLRSLLGAKRTSLFALHMSANDPKRTLAWMAAIRIVVSEAVLEQRGWSQRY